MLRSKSDTDGSMASNDDQETASHHSRMSTDESEKNRRTSTWRYCMNSTRIMVLVILCLQNSLFTLLRRYSQGVKKEEYSKYEILLFGEVLKMIFSAHKIQTESEESGTGIRWTDKLVQLVQTSRKMVILALIYGSMNILSFVALRNIGAGMFTIFAQCKILTTAVCSTLMLKRQYSWTQWRALISLSMGVLLFSSPIWMKKESAPDGDTASTVIGVSAVLTEITLSGFASIYFEKVIKKDPQKVTIWERNFQLALASFPVYLCFIVVDSPNGIGHGWSLLALVVASLGAAGGLLVALSIKYGDSILKTLATTGAIILSSLLDYLFMDGPLTPVMMIAAGQVVLAICNYTFDATPPREPKTKEESRIKGKGDDEELAMVGRTPTRIST